MSESEMPWRKSSFSVVGDCVAVRALADGSVAIRNTNDPDGRVLLVSGAAMADLLTRIKDGVFDDLV